MEFNQAGGEYVNSGTISDGAVIGATGVRLTNSESGRLYGGVTFTVGGSTLINELGGVVRLSQFDQTYPLIVTGSSGADTVFNAGIIAGTVALGGGADIYVDRDGSDYGINLGSGDDVYRREGTQALFLRAEGGEGRDRVVLAGTGQYWGPSLTGFEDLTIEVGGNFTQFSGYQSITLAPTLAQTTGWSFVNLIDCLNPTVDLLLAGQSVILQRSSLRSVTGSEGADSLEIGFGNVIGGAISLGGGNDGLTLSSNQAAGAPALSVPIDGGGGIDTLMLHWFEAGSRSFDFSTFQGFEKLNVNAWYGVDPSTANVAHLSGLTDIDIGRSVTLILSDVVSPEARAGGGYGGGLTIEAGSVINRYGISEEFALMWEGFVDVPQGDPANSSIILNDGTIIADVRFFTGDDVYDGRDGSVGGAIYGNAGNDILLGGVGAETMYGGYGADTLEGNGGADTLTGGPGNDVFRGTAAGLNGDTITDFGSGDRILIGNASIAGFEFSLSGSTLNYTGGTLTLAGFAARLSASAAAGGGVELVLARATVQNDFNGDGRSDVLWRHDSGLVTNWLGGASGSFANNQANASLAVPTDWKIVGTGDFNGDGRSDILWRHDRGMVTDWLGTASGGFVNNQANSGTVVPTDWKIAGTGDFNGDGRDDIVWRHDSGLFTSWLGTANGGFANNHANSAATVPTDWRIMATGDFNGDGRVDLLWRHEGGTITDWLGTVSGGFVNNHANAAAIVPTEWHIIGAGDFNGDGRDDILFRHDNGALMSWLGRANGGFVQNDGAPGASVGRDWEVAGIGDYNGDGRDDLLWRHDSGAITEWLGTPSGGFVNNHANAVASVPTDWKIQSPDIFLL